MPKTKTELTKLLEAHQVRNLLLKKLPMEFFGTFALCYFGGMSVAMVDNQISNTNCVALTHGGILTVMIYLGANISGAHYNPAVSLGFFLMEQEDFMKLMMYSAAQIFGGMLAGAFISLNLNQAWVTPMILDNGSVLGYPNVNPSFGRLQAFIGEMVGTFMMMLAICIANEKFEHKPEKKGNYALSIGLILMAIIYGIGPISGAALNPARFLGPMIVGGKLGTSTTPYLAGTFCGSITAVFVYLSFLKFDAGLDEAKEFGAIDGGGEEKKEELRLELEAEMDRQIPGASEMK